MAEEMPAPPSEGDNAEAYSDLKAVEAIPTPPPPPDTGTPIQLSQKINVYNIPPSVWDRLDSSQIVDLSKEVLRQADVVDERHYNFAMAQAARDASGKKWAVSVGALIAVAGFVAAAYLAVSGHTASAMFISLPLTTILAIVVGNRFLD